MPCSFGIMPSYLSGKQIITDGEIKFDINNERGNSIESAVSTATCKDGYLMISLIGKTFDVF